MTKQARSLAIVVFIAVLHAPLILHVLALHDALAPGQGLTDASVPSLLIAFALLLLPYVALSASGIDWNPERARLNEYLDD